MRNKANCRDIAVNIRRQRSHHGPFFAERDVDQPHGLQLLFQQI
ncbi:Uncharacterised protein [Enterobacter hormaechei]|nr:Uncharacterised protein [Enterobacter hormaechei]SAD79137.1 Uncharacterised protein [Enterobacter hormaechei]SAF22218.1 Uncharacterised protein [Enterobacter hormaechei]